MINQLFTDEMAIKIYTISNKNAHKLLDVQHFEDANIHIVVKLGKMIFKASNVIGAPESASDTSNKFTVVQHF